MGFVSNREDVRLSVALLATSCVFVGSAASAVEPSTQDASVQKFENVRVINRPVTTPSASAALPGMRAYKDVETGEFRAPTAEEAAALSPVAPDQQRLRRFDAAAAPVAHATRSGGTALMLDESSMQYSVVSRRADGSLVEICVPGEKAATEAVRNPDAFNAAARSQESRNDR